MKTITPEQESAPGGDQEVALIPDSTNLTWLGETADGNRGVELYLVMDNEGKLQLVPTDQVKDLKKLAPVMTPKKLPSRTEVTEVVCKAQGYSQALPTKDKYDAVFWTESSVEKFLYPYYRSHRIWDKKMDELKEKFEKYVNAIAIAHRAPSTSSLVVSDTVEVGVIDAGDLHWMTVDQFLAL